MPEAGVEQMQHGVFRAADVEIHRHPVFFLRRIDHGGIVFRIDVAQVVPARAGPLRHGIRLAPRGAAAGRAGRPEPVGRARQRGLAVGRRAVVLHFGQAHGQVFFRHGHHPALLAMQQRERLAPEALAAEEPVAQLVVHFAGALARLLQPGHDALLEFRRRQAVVLAGIDGDAVVHEAAPIDARRRLHHLHDRQAEFRRELEVARVVRRHRHDGARAVAPQHVVRHPDRDFLSVDRIDRVGAGEDAGLLLGQFGALKVALAGGGDAVRRHGLGLLGRRDLRHQRMLRREDHVGRAEQRVRPRREHADRFAADGEIDFRAFALADPVALHFLDALGPVEAVEVRQQPLGVRGDLEHPLAHRAALHAEALRAPFLDLFVRQHGAEVGAPVHGQLALIGQPALEELQENPLRPAHVVFVRRRDLAVPVVGKAQHLELAAERRDVLVGDLARMVAGLDGVLLRRQAERVVAHRVQDVEALHPLEARLDVRGRVALRMPHVQARAAGIRKHVQHVELGLGRIDVVRGAERLVLLPVLLPLRFDVGMRIRHGFTSKWIQPATLAPRPPPINARFRCAAAPPRLHSRP